MLNMSQWQSNVVVNTTCPDEDMPEGYTVADPVEPEDAVVPVKAKENPAKLDGFGL